MAYSKDLKISVVNALESGLSLRKTAKEFGISRSTVNIWKKKAKNEQVLEPKKKKSRSSKNQDLLLLKNL